MSREFSQFVNFLDIHPVRELNLYILLAFRFVNFDDWVFVNLRVFHDFFKFLLIFIINKWDSQAVIGLECDNIPSLKELIDGVKVRLFLFSYVKLKRRSTSQVPKDFENLTSGGILVCGVKLGPSLFNQKHPEFSICERWYLLDIGHYKIIDNHILLISIDQEFKAINSLLRVGLSLCIKQILNILFVLRKSRNSTDKGIISECVHLVVKHGLDIPRFD